MAVIEFWLDDVVELRKRHPCGSVRWSVVRLGADIGLVCAGCERRVLLARPLLERRLKRFLERGGEAGESSDGPAGPAGPGEGSAA